MAEVMRGRPKYMNIFEIRLPMPGLASILHRISGVGLFLALPLLLCALERSLRSPAEYAQLMAQLGHPAIKLALLGLLWALLHHLCMGVRILLIDVHVGVAKARARASAAAVFAVSIGLTFALGVALW